MPNPPLRKDFVDTRAPKINELPASEYNRHAGRTDAAYDEAFAASALAAAAMNLANQLAAGKVDKSAVTAFITGLFSATNQAAAQEILGFQPASSKLSVMLAAISAGAGATVRVPLFSESGNSWTYINTTPYGRGLFGVADAATLLANIGAVAKAAGNARVYIRNGNGDETTGGYANAATAGTFPVRGADGTFDVGAPSGASHPVRRSDWLRAKRNSVVQSGAFTSIERDRVAAAYQIGTGVCRLTFFEAPVSMNAGSVTVPTGNIAAAATPTVCRVGVWSYDPVTDRITLIGSTPNDTSLFAAADTAYTKAFSAPIAFVAGNLYAWAPLVVSSAATPNVLGSPLYGTGAAASESALPPRIRAQITGLADLPAAGTELAMTGAHGSGFAPLYARFNPAA